jgi:dipeptidyl aminopeptidase/acylaminoacyl peptidase
MRRVADAIIRTWGTSEMAWTPDSRTVLVPVLPEGVSVEQAAGPAPAKPDGGAEAGKPTVTVFEFRPQAAGGDRAPEKGAWSTDFLRADLAAIDVETGRLRRLVRNEKVVGFWMAPDGSRVAYTLDRGFLAAESQQQVYDVQVVPIAGGEPRVVAKRAPLAALGIAAAWSPDAKAIAYLTTSGEAFVVPPGGGASPRKLATPPGRFQLDALAAPFFSSSGAALHFLSGDAIWKIAVRDASAPVAWRIRGREFRALVPGGRADVLLVVTRAADSKDEGLYEVSLGSGETRELLEGGRSLGRDPSVRVSAGARTIAFASQDAGHPEDLWALSRAAPEPRRLTRINPAFDSIAMGGSRLVEWLNADGKKLKGALLLPAGYREGVRYPLVVFVYGGARLSDSVHTFGMRGAWGADDNFQLLATRGYAVLLPDAPSDWKDQMRDLARNVLPGVNRVVELGIADPERVGIMGHSNGGYSTLALITQTTRFRAAVMRAGMGDFVSFYGELGRDGTHYGLGVAEYAFGMGNPWTARARFVENSPIFYLDRVETPLLIVHGSIDIAVAPFLAEQVFVGLRRLGKEVVYARYEGEGHQLESYANQVDYCNRMLAWFDEHLKKGAP